MSFEFLKRVTDYFEPWELVQMLPLTIEDIVEIFQEEILECEHDLNEIMRYEKDDLPE